METEIGIGIEGDRGLISDPDIPIAVVDEPEDTDTHEHELRTGG